MSDDLTRGAKALDFWLDVLPFLLFPKAFARVSSIGEWSKVAAVFVWKKKEFWVPLKRPR